MRVEFTTESQGRAVTCDRRNRVAARRIENDGNASSDRVGNARVHG